MSNNTPARIPTLKEIHEDNADAFRNDQLKTLLNQAPPPQWVKKHPMTGVPYMPVDKVEFLLDKIFGRWRREILNTFQIENAVCCTVRLHYWNPTVGEWDFHDGNGAMPIQVEKEARASDMTQIKTAAIQLAVGAAASYALKDAADNLGKMFGRDVTRKDTIAYSPTYTEAPTNTQEPPPPPPPPIPQHLEQKQIQQQPVAFPANAFADAFGGASASDIKIDF